MTERISASELSIGTCQIKRQYVTTLTFLTVFSSRGSGKSINTQKYENIIPLKTPVDTLVHLTVLILFYFL